MAETVDLGTIQAPIGFDLAPAREGASALDKIVQGVVENLERLGSVPIKVPKGLATLGESLAGIRADATEAAGSLERLSAILSPIAAVAREAGAGIGMVAREIRATSIASTSATKNLDTVAKRLGAIGDVAEPASVSMAAFAESEVRAADAAVDAGAGFGVVASRLRSVTGAANTAAAAMKRAAAAGADTTAISTEASMANAAPLVPARRRAPSPAAGLGMAGVGAEALTAGALGTAYYASTLDVMAQRMMGNTTLTPAQRSAVEASVVRALQQGIPLSEQALFNAYMHEANYGYVGPRADLLGRIAEHMAVGTGAPVDIQAQILAGSAGKGAFNIPDSQLQAFAEMLHIAAASSDLTLEQFSKYSTKSEGSALRGHISPAEWAAAFVTIVQTRVKPANADTYLAGMLNQLVAPSSLTVKRAAAISKRSGVDLLQYFGVEGMQRYGIQGFLEALHQPGITEQDVANIFPSLRGGYALSRLYRNPELFQQHLYSPTIGTYTALGGGLHNIDPLFNRMMNTPGMAIAEEVSRNKGNAYESGERMQGDLVNIVHILGDLAGAALKVIDVFSRLPATVRHGVEDLGIALIANRLSKSLFGSVGIDLGGIARVGAYSRLGRGLRLDKLGDWLSGFGGRGSSPANPLFVSPVGPGGLGGGAGSAVAGAGESEAAAGAATVGASGLGAAEITGTAGVAALALPLFRMYDARSAKGQAYVDQKPYVDTWMGPRELTPEEANKKFTPGRMVMSEQPMTLARWVSDPETELNQLGRKIQAWFNTETGAFTTWAKGLGRKIAADFSGIGGEILRSIESWPSRFMTAARQTGQSLDQGILSGLRSNAGAIEGEISGLAGRVQGWLQEHFQHHSPSLLSMPTGEALAEGIGAGFQNRFHDISGRIASEALALGVDLAGRGHHGRHRKPANYGPMNQRADIASRLRWERAEGNPVAVAMDTAALALANPHLTASSRAQIEQNLQKQLEAIDKKAAAEREKLWEGHVKRLQGLTSQASRMMVSMQADTLRAHGENAKADLADALAQAGDIRAERGDQIEQWRIDHGYSAAQAKADPTYKAMVAAADAEQQALIQKANDDYARAMQDHAKALDEFTTTLARQKAAYDRRGESPQTRYLDTLDQLADERKQQVDNLNANAQEWFGGDPAGWIKYQMAFGQIDQAYQAGVGAADYQKTLDEQTEAMKKLADTVESLRTAHENTATFGSHWMTQNGMSPETAEKYLSDLEAIREEIASWKINDPDALKEQQQLLMEVAVLMKQASDQTQEAATGLKAFAMEFSQVVGQITGDALTRTLEWSQESHKDQPKTTFGKVFARNLREETLHTMDQWAGELLSRNVSGALGGIFGHVFGSGNKKEKKPDGTKSNPIHTIVDNAKGGGNDPNSPQKPNDPGNPSAPSPGGAQGQIEQQAEKKAIPWLMQGNNALMAGGYVADAAALYNLSKKKGKHRFLGVLGGIAGGVLGFMGGGPIGAEYGFAAGSYLGGQFARGGQMDLSKYNIVGEHGTEMVAPGGYVIPLSDGWRPSVPMFEGGRSRPRRGEGTLHMPVTINHYGDINGGEDVKSLYDNSAWMIAQRYQIARSDPTIP